MRPSILDDLGIITTISWLCKEFESVYPEIKIEREIDIDEDEVPDSLKIVIFRILQEALNNISKHSRANHAFVTVENIRGKIELTVEDNGKGFDVTNELLESKNDKGIGLANMRRRSELSGGLFLIDSIKGKGSTIRVTWSHEELKKLSA
jgi:signal transduction histidine kinase